MHTKHVFAFSYLLISFFTFSQNFYRPDFYVIERSPNPRHFKIPKASGDSAFLIDPPNKLILMDLKKGKILSELKLPKEVNSSDYSLIRRCFAHDKGIEIITIEKANDQITFHKDLIGNDLTITPLIRPFTIQIDAQKERGDFEIRKKLNHYEITYTIGCNKDDKSNFFQLLTLNSNLEILDSYVCKGEKRRYIRCIVPQDDFSNNIYYQIILDYKDSPITSHILLKPEQNGKIRKVTTKMLNPYSNFTEIYDSLGKHYGYCTQLSNLKKDNYQLSLHKYELDFKTGEGKIILNELIKKNIPAEIEPDICLKTIINENKIKMLLYPVEKYPIKSISGPGYQVNHVNMNGGIGIGFGNSSGSGYSESKVSHVSYYGFEGDSILISHDFPFHFFVGLNPWGGSKIFMGLCGNDTYIGYNDEPENSEPKSEEDIKNIPMVNGDKLNYGPVFYKILETGHINKLALKDLGRENFMRGILDPELGYQNADGDLYFPYWSRSTGTSLIVKFKPFKPE